MSAVTISVAISTFNRARLLGGTLSSLSAQRGMTGCDVEVLVVDNNSVDDTAGVVRRFAGDLPLRYIREPQQGLSFARNRALDKAKGEWIVFTDDDVVIGEGWLSAYRSAVAAYPEACYLGGRVLPLWEQLKPRWLKDESMPLIDGVLGHYDLGPATRKYRQDDPVPFGANFAVRRAWANDLGGFGTHLGVRGRSIGRGEETDLFLRAMRAGARGVYLGGALVHHRVEPARLALGYLFRYGIASGEAHYLLRGSQPEGSVRRAAGFLLRGLFQAVKGRGDRFRQCVINSGIEVGLARASRSDGGH